MQHRKSSSISNQYIHTLKGMSVWWFLKMRSICCSHNKAVWSIYLGVLFDCLRETENSCCQTGKITGIRYRRIHLLLPIVGIVLPFILGMGMIRWQIDWTITYLWELFHGLRETENLCCQTGKITGICNRQIHLLLPRHACERALKLCSLSENGVIKYTQAVSDTDPM